MIGAVEAGGTKFVCALARPDGTIVARAAFATDTPEATFRQLRSFLAETSASHGAMTGLGVGSFGPVELDPASPDFGKFTTTPKPGWSGASWREALAPIAAPMQIDTDVNAAALGEWLHGAGRGCATLAYTTVGTGIGSGIVRHGRSQRGVSHYEAGHIPVARKLAADAFPGCCPYHGDCLEGLASGPAIAARWGRDLSQATDVPDAGDLIAGYLAQLAASLVLLHMPHRLVFGGGVMQTPGLLESLRRHTGERLAGYVPWLAGDLADYIVAPGLDQDAGLIGAIELGRRAAEGNSAA